MAHDTLCVRITRQIKEYEGEGETLDPPLYDVIDTDALERLIQSSTPDADEDGCVVSFTYCDYTVTVDSEGAVNVTPQESSRLPLASQLTS